MDEKNAYISEKEKINHQVIRIFIILLFLQFIDNCLLNCKRDICHIYFKEE